MNKNIFVDMAELMLMGKKKRVPLKKFIDIESIKSYRKQVADEHGMPGAIVSFEYESR